MQVFIGKKLISNFSIHRVKYKNTANFIEYICFQESDNPQGRCCSRRSQPLSVYGYLYMCLFALGGWKAEIENIHLSTRPPPFSPSKLTGTQINFKFTRSTTLS